MKIKVLITSILACSLGALLFFAGGSLMLKRDKKNISSIDELIALTESYEITDHREEESRYILHNLALALRRRDSALAPDTVLLGSSRSKPIALHQFTQANTLNLAGNSYGEMPQGLLAEAKMAHALFPNAKTFVIEASFLFRRPADLTVAADHEKYRFLLDKFKSPDDVASSASWKDNLKSIFSSRDRLRLSHIFRSPKRPFDTKEMKTLDIYGESNISVLSFYGPQTWPAITDSNPKVTRIKDNRNFIPGDEVFDSLAKWSRENNINLILFIPPVRNDFLKIKVELGLQDHIDDLVKLAARTQVTLISFLNDPVFSDSPNLFSDEDHLSTCLGSGILSTNISKAVQGKLTPDHSLSTNELKHIELICSSSKHVQETK